MGIGKTIADDGVFSFTDCKTDDYNDDGVCFLMDSRMDDYNDGGLQFRKDSTMYIIRIAINYG